MINFWKVTVRKVSFKLGKLISCMTIFQSTNDLTIKDM